MDSFPKEKPACVDVRGGCERHVDTLRFDASAKGRVIVNQEVLTDDIGLRVEATVRAKQVRSKRERGGSAFESVIRREHGAPFIATQNCAIVSMFSEPFEECVPVAFGWRSMGTERRERFLKGTRGA